MCHTGVLAGRPGKRHTAHCEDAVFWAYWPLAQCQHGDFPAAGPVLVHVRAGLAVFADAGAGGGATAAHRAGNV